VYAFDPAAGTYGFATFLSSSGTWTGATNAVNARLQPGNGVFLQIPAAATLPQTLTFVGNVLVGTNSTGIASGYQIAGSKLPMAGALKTGLGYAPANLDRVYQWNNLSQSYSAAKTFLSSSGTWTPSEPVISVGEGFWLQGHPGSAWTQIYTNTP
jgi:hypothetical protein